VCLCVLFIETGIFSCIAALLFICLIACVYTVRFRGRYSYQDFTRGNELLAIDMRIKRSLRSYGAKNSRRKVNCDVDGKTSKLGRREKRSSWLRRGANSSSVAGDQRCVDARAVYDHDVDIELGCGSFHEKRGMDGARVRIDDKTGNIVESSRESFAASAFGSPHRKVRLSVCFLSSLVLLLNVLHVEKFGRHA